MLTKFKVFTLLIVCLLPFVGTSQTTVRYNTNFENNHDFVVIDTTQPNNIWQIGKPNKLGFDSAFYSPYAIVTDSINLYPTNNLSSFQIKVKAPYKSFCWSAVSLGFLHKYDTDSLQAGGYIDISYDGGLHWKNIINDSAEHMIVDKSNFYNKYDTILNGVAVFSGKSNGWVSSNFYWYREDSIAILVDSMLVRFNFISSSIAYKKNGWIIDNLSIEVGSFCGVGVNDIAEIKETVKVYPNPVFDISTLAFSNFTENNYQLNIYNINGILVKNIRNLSQRSIQIRQSDYPKGMYFYKITTQNGNIITGKFIVQ